MGNPHKQLWDPLIPMGGLLFSPQTSIFALLKLRNTKRMKEGTILIVDDNKAILTAVRLLLKMYFEKVITLSKPTGIPAALRENRVDVVLLDMNFSAGINNGNEGLFWLSEIKRTDNSIQVVLFTAYADIDLAVKGIKEGATDFVVKPWENQKLVETLQSAYRLKQASGNPESLETSGTTDSRMFWGDSPAMTRLRQLVEKVARTDANILITGENGTGKEMLAREIHRLSGRNRGPLVTVDMGALTETLFESELFGHVKGAFTDARADREGKFEAANGGSLFLDEIGNLSYHLQAKLLTALQRRSIVRVGSNTPIPVNIRLIAATNRNLEEMVQRGEFREDLLYRINTIHLEIPPLRKRTEDIGPLSELFIKKYASLYGKPAVSLSEEALDLLKRQPWMGNIRELEHTVEKALIISEGKTLEADCFDFPQAKAIETPTTEITTLEAMEYKLITESMQRNDANLSLVAAELGISRQTLYNKLKKYGI